MRPGAARQHGAVSSVTLFGWEPVELVYERVPAYVLLALSAIKPLQSEAFKLLGVEPHTAPSLARTGEADPQPTAALT